jgi:hypothetical protein
MVDDSIPREQLMEVSQIIEETPWYADNVNFLLCEGLFQVQCPKRRRRRRRKVGNFALPLFTLWWTCKHI